MDAPSRTQPVNVAREKPVYTTRDKKYVIMGTRRQRQGGTCKVFSVLAVTVNTCVLRATTKKVVNFFFRKKCPPGKKILRVGMYVITGSVCSTVALKTTRDYEPC